MNSLRRMLDVLDLFKPEQPVISVEMICNQLNYTPASAYRYVRELSAVGLLVKLPRGYALGPRVIELDRQMTEYDPLLSPLPRRHSQRTSTVTSRPSNVAATVPIEVVVRSAVERVSISSTVPSP